MRRSLGGGTHNGGGTLKTFLRAARAVRAAGDSLSRSSTSSSSFYKPLSLSTTTTATASPRPMLLSASTNRIGDEFDWVSVNESGAEFGLEFGSNIDDDVFFGSVPSSDEVLNAVSALQLNIDNDDVYLGSVPSSYEVLNAVSALHLVVDPTHYSHFLEDNRAYNLENAIALENASPSRFPSRVSSFGSESDWIEPSLHICYPSMLEHHGSIRVYDALHLLQTEPSIKRMVISLSCDKAVWEAVLNNEMVRELRDSLSEVENKVPEDHGDNNAEPDRVTNIFSWVYEQTKMKMIEIIEKIVDIVNELFQPSEDEEIEECTTGRTEELLQISLMLSIMVLIIVVVNRGQGSGS